MLAATLDESKDLARWIGRRLFDQAIGGEERGKLACTLWSIVLEHHCSIIELTEKRHGASARALLRPMWDAYTRGLWLAYRASEEEFERFKGGADPPRQMLKQLEEVEAFKDGQLSRIKAETYRLLCDFTHTGLQQVLGNMTVDTIEPVYTDRELQIVLISSDGWAQFAAAAIAGLTGDEALIDELVNRARLEAARIERLLGA